MNKMIKMSLVAAVAVAGLTSTASAGNMEEMIKDTKMSGYVRYRLETDHENKTDMNERAKVVAKITTPVNDMVTANVKMVAGETSTQKADTKAAMNITEGNFVINAAGATVIAGLQTSQSPFFANNGDTRSHGVTALVPAGPATIAAAYYTTSTPSYAAAAMTNNVMALGALVKAGPANVNLWYASVEDGADVSVAAENDGVLALGTDGASAMSAQVTVAAGPVNLDVMHTALDAGNGAEGSLTKAVVSGKAGALSFAAGYAMTGDDALGGQVTLDNDSDAVSDLAMHNLNMQGTIDASAIYAMAKMQINDTTCASLAYLGGSSDAHADFDETNIKVGYKMSKNFSISAIYAMGTAPTAASTTDAVAATAGPDGLDGNADDTAAVAATTTPAGEADFAMSRIEIKYTF